MPTPIILDADPGHDDAVAILMAAASPAIDLLAITCVAGNAPLANTQENARKVLTVAGITDVPVAAGLDGPLVRPLATAANVHGTTGLDVTHRALVGPEEKERIRALATPVGLLVAGLLDFYGRHHRARYGWDAVPLHDACCVAEVIRPGLITTRPMNVQIETVGELTLGRTVCDVWGVSGRSPNADVGVDIDRQGFLDVLMDCLQRY